MAKSGHIIFYLLSCGEVIWSSFFWQLHRAVPKTGFCQIYQGFLIFCIAFTDTDWYEIIQNSLLYWVKYIRYQEGKCESLAFHSDTVIWFRKVLTYRRNKLINSYLLRHFTTILSNLYLGEVQNLWSVHVFCTIIAPIKVAELINNDDVVTVWQLITTLIMHIYSCVEC